MNKTILLCISYVAIQVLTVLNTGLHSGMTPDQYQQLIIQALIAGTIALHGFLQNPESTSTSPSKEEPATVPAPTSPTQP